MYKAEQSLGVNMSSSPKARAAPRRAVVVETESNKWPVPWWYVFECQSTGFRSRFLGKMLKERLAR
ncbi:hypothetical protein, partial [Neoaquamicrobium sediminum]|uniref:hypothetical protein n=1 Tax=Neoaquamicrobium sediminum TaxID=1849104 RepID=UPI0040365730